MDSIRRNISISDGSGIDIISNRNFSNQIREKMIRKWGAMDVDALSEALEDRARKASGAGIDIEELSQEVNRSPLGLRNKS